MVEIGTTFKDERWRTPRLGERVTILPDGYEDVDVALADFLDRVDAEIDPDNNWPQTPLELGKKLRQDLELGIRDPYSYEVGLANRVKFKDILPFVPMVYEPQKVGLGPNGIRLFASLAFIRATRFEGQAVGITKIVQATKDAWGTHLLGTQLRTPEDSHAYDLAQRLGRIAALEKDNPNIGLVVYQEVDDDMEEEQEDSGIYEGMPNKNIRDFMVWFEQEYISKQTYPYWTWHLEKELAEPLDMKVTDLNNFKGALHRSGIFKPLVVKTDDMAYWSTGQQAYDADRLRTFVILRWMTGEHDNYTQVDWNQVYDRTKASLGDHYLLQFVINPHMGEILTVSEKQAKITYEEYIAAHPQRPARGYASVEEEGLRKMLESAEEGMEHMEGRWPRSLYSMKGSEYADPLLMRVPDFASFQSIVRRKGIIPAFILHTESLGVRYPSNWFEKDHYRAFAALRWGVRELYGDITNFDAINWKIVVTRVKATLGTDEIAGFIRDVEASDENVILTPETSVKREPTTVEEYREMYPEKERDFSGIQNDTLRNILEANEKALDASYGTWPEMAGGMSNPGASTSYPLNMKTGEFAQFYSQIRDRRIVRSVRLRDTEMRKTATYFSKNHRRAIAVMSWAARDVYGDNPNYFELDWKPVIVRAKQALGDDEIADFIHFVDGMSEEDLVAHPREVIDLHEDPSVTQEGEEMIGQAGTNGSVVDSLQASFEAPRELDGFIEEELENEGSVDGGFIGTPPLFDSEHASSYVNGQTRNDVRNVPLEDLQITIERKVARHVEEPSQVIFDSGKSRSRLHEKTAEEVDRDNLDGTTLTIRQIREAAKEREEREKAAVNWSKAKKKGESEQNVPKIPGYSDAGNQTVEGLSIGEPFRNGGLFGTVERFEIIEGVPYVTVVYEGGTISRFPARSIGRTHFRLEKTER